MTMQDMVTMVRDVGIPAVFSVGLGWCLYKIGHTAGTLLVDAWKGKDSRLAALEMRVTEINNGQRAALEKRFDMALEVQRQSTEAHQQVATVLSHQTEALRGFVRQCPLASDSDADRLAMIDIEEKTRAVISRQRERQAKREGEA